MDVLWIWEWKMVENWWNTWIFTWKAPSHKASLWMFDSTSTRSGSLGTVFDNGFLMNTDAGRNELATKTYDWLNDRCCCSQSRWNCDQRVRYKDLATSKTLGISPIVVESTWWWTVMHLVLSLFLHLRKWFAFLHTMICIHWGYILYPCTLNDITQ